VSDRKKPEASEAMVRLVVEDADEYERMVAEGHRDLCIEYQPLIPGIVDAAVMGRQVTGELKEARDYLKECPVCAEALEASSKALRDLQEEDGQAEGEPYEPPRPDPPPAPPKEPGRVEVWWRRFTKTRAGLVSAVGAVMCVVALVGLVLHSGRQCSREDARRERFDAGAPTSTEIDAGARLQTVDASMDPRTWLRTKGPLSFVFITLHLAGQRQRSSLTALVDAQRQVARLVKAGMASKAALQRLGVVVENEATAVGRLAGPLKQAAAFVARVKDDGTTPDFARHLAAAKKQLAQRSRAQSRLNKLIAALRKQLESLAGNRPR